MTPFKPFQLSTERLVIRFLDEADLPALYAMYSHPEVMRYWSYAPWTEMDQSRQMLQDTLAGYQDGSGLQMGIARTSERELVGMCSLFHFHMPSRRAELGYALGRPYWGSGYMHEALLAVVEHAFHTLHLNRLEADIDPRNLASARTLERLGFKLEGVLRERWIVGEEVTDTGLYGLLRREWLERSRQG